MVAISKTRVGQLILEKAAELGLLGVTEATTLALEKEAAAALLAEASFAPLLIVTGAFLALAAGIGIVIAAVNAYSEQEKARQEALQASIDLSNQTVTAIKENKDALDELYSSYQKTGEAIGQAGASCHV